VAAADDEPTLLFATPADWERWLERHHATSPGIWLKLGRRRTGGAASTVTYQEALDVALCFGWIDARKRSFDEAFWAQRFTPRSRRSRWSRRNRDRIAELAASGRMRPPGAAEVERAKADGRWDAAYAGPRTASVPPDLQAALDRNPGARDFFATLDSANRYAILYRVEEAKRPQTRAARIERFVAMLAAGEKIHA
jgi:uncharacterized protein YdeI (YjbR/CyaY-like superfamily)